MENLRRFSIPSFRLEGVKEIPSLLRQKAEENAKAETTEEAAEQE